MDRIWDCRRSVFKRKNSEKRHRNTYLIVNEWGGVWVVRQLYKTETRERVTFWLHATNTCDQCGACQQAYRFRRGDYHGEYVEQMLCFSCADTGRFWKPELSAGGAGVITVIPVEFLPPSATPCPYVGVPLVNVRGNLSVFDVADRQLENELVIDDAKISAGNLSLATQDKRLLN